MAGGPERNVFAELKPIFLESLREEFDSLFPGSRLTSLLGKVEVQQKLRHMRKTGLLSTDEWQDLFPTPETQGNSTTFDVPLLFKLIREFSDLEPPHTGWDDVASHNDHSSSADIVKIVQCYRTLCGQSDETELSDSVVEGNLFIMEDVLKRRSHVIYDKFMSLELTKMHYKGLGSEKKENIPEATQSTSTETDLQLKFETSICWAGDQCIFVELSMKCSTTPFSSKPSKVEKVLEDIPVESYQDIVRSLRRGKEDPKTILIIGKPGIVIISVCTKLMQDCFFLGLKYSYLLRLGALDLLGNAAVYLCDMLNYHAHTVDKGTVFCETPVDNETFNDIVSHPHEVVIVLDGFDEYHQRADIINDSEKKYPNDPRTKMPVSALCAKLIKGKILRDCLIVVTSTPDAAEEMGTIQFDEYWKLVGFSHSSLSSGVPPSLEATREFSTLTLSREESLLSKRGNPTVMLKALKARHASVIQASQFDFNQQLKRHEELINYVMKLSPKHTSSFRLLSKENTSGIGYKSITDMNYVLGKLGLNFDSTPTSQFENSRLTNRQISEDEVIPAYLKETSRQIQALHQKKGRVYCAVPYYRGQTAVVVYAHDPTADLCKKDWSSEFLGFPVFIVDLTYGYETDPLIFPECLPQIPEDTYVKCSEVKDEVTRELTKKHSNISTVCVDYRIKMNKIVAGEICIQIGVLTKGFVPLGEKCLPRVFDDVAVDVIESNASFCVLPDLRIYPVNLGVGIGVEGDGSSTGSIGAVVKLNEQPNKLFILSNAHVLYRENEGATTLSITQPSQQEYEEKQAEIEKSIAMHANKVEQLENIIDQRQTLSQSVRRQEEELTKKLKHLQELEIDLQSILDMQSPRSIGLFTGETGSFVRNPMYRIEPDEFEPEEGMTRRYHKEPRYYGIDAAIAKIEKDEFEPEDMTRMYTWSNDLFDERKNNIEEIQLNGKFIDEETIRRSLKEKVTVFKCGRSTGVTKGVLYTEMNVRMTGGFENFIKDDSHTVSNASDELWYNVLHIKSTTKRGHELRSFSVPGDSGAVVFDESGTCVGLLFGRIDTQLSRQGGGLATPIHAVFEALKVSLATPEDLQRLLMNEKPVE